jgi:hypothetical protein
MTKVEAIKVIPQIKKKRYSKFKFKRNIVNYLNLKEED